MASANIKILPVVVEDLPTLARIESIGFAGPLTETMMGEPTPQSQASRAQQLLNDFSESPTIHIEKAVWIESGKPDEIIGFALWHFYKEPRPLENWVDKDEEFFKGFRSIECANEFFAGMSRKRDQWVNGKKYAFLQSLVVVPEKHGLGAGSALLGQGLKAAGEADLPAYLQSSPSGYKIYKKFGYKEVDEFSVDLGKYGGTGEAKTVCMLRPAGTKLI